MPHTAAEVAEIAYIQGRAIELLRILFARDCQIYAHEITVPMYSHADACAVLRDVRELLARAEGKL